MLLCTENSPKVSVLADLLFLHPSPSVSPSSKDQAEMDPADMEDVEEVEEEETGEDENSKGKQATWLLKICLEMCCKCESMPKVQLMKCIKALEDGC